LGIFQPVDIRQIEKELNELSRFQVEDEYAKYDAFETRLADIAKKTGIVISSAKEKEAKALSYEEIDNALTHAESSINSLVEEKQNIETDIRAKELMLSSFKGYDIPFYMSRPYAYSFLKVELGKLEEKDIPILEENLKNIPHVLYPFKTEGGRVVTLLIGLRKDRDNLEAALKYISWQRLELPQEPQKLSEEIKAKTAVEITECLKKIDGIKGKIKESGDELHEKLSLVKFSVTLKKSLLEAKKFSCTTGKTALISGWIPREDKAKLIKEMKKVDKYSYVETKAAGKVNIEKDEIPVRLKNNFFIRPFELLINSYGIPRYDSIDPTMFVAVSFLLMFGAMFGDIGHGMVVGILGLLLLIKGKTPVMKQGGALALYCGTSAAIFGVLYGSFFGVEFHALWIKPMESILTIFGVCVMFGIVMMTIGIVLNLVNSFKDRDYLKLIFDKSGLIAGVIYWAGIAMVSKLIVSKGALPMVYIYIILGCIILFLSHPIVELIVKKKKEGMAISFMEGMIDVLEILMLYLANTVSFIRIAAFSLAHAGLFLSIFELARLVKGSAGNIAVFVVGNIVVIMLEGLVVSIQSIRLNYYEFFSKFFMTGKRAYKPLTL
jgi:V/A-type H+/Na+-transporting ATPase subunit I